MRTVQRVCVCFTTPTERPYWSLFRFSNLNPAISPWYFYDAACAAESPIINPFPTTTTTTATTTTKTIPTASPLCGVVGYNGPINAYFQFVDDSPTPYNDCSGECYYDSQCLSFAMNPSDTNHCYMYNTTVYVTAILFPPFSSTWDPCVLTYNTSVRRMWILSQAAHSHSTMYGAHRQQQHQQVLQWPLRPLLQPQFEQSFPIDNTSWNFGVRKGNIGNLSELGHSSKADCF
jgi:hypothetical protein